MILRSHKSIPKEMGKHETPQAPMSSNFDSGAKSAPGFSPSNQSCTLRRQMVFPDKSANSIDAISKPAKSHLKKFALLDDRDETFEEKKLDIDQPAQVLLNFKTPETFHQVQPDSESSEDDHEVSKSGHALNHVTRQSNLNPGFERDPKIKIDFPKSIDTTRWKELNQIRQILRS